MSRVDSVTGISLEPPRQYAMDMFRIGGPRPLAPTPIEFAVASTEPICSIWPTLRPMVQSHLSDQGVSAYDMRVVHRRATQEPEPGVDDTTVLIVTEARSDRAWFTARDNILQTFQTSGQPTLNVEFCDPRAIRGKSTWPILPNEPACRLWPKIHQQVLAALEGLLWRTLVFVHRGYDNKSLSKPTILVTEHRGSLSNWNQARMNQICAQNHLDYEIIEDNNLELADEWAGQYSMEEFTEENGLLPIKMGASCSARGSTASGTIGGFINLTRDGVTAKYGLTCFHVFNSIIDTEKFNSTGIRPSQGIPLGVLVDSPSGVDRDTSREYWGREVARTGKSIQRVEEEIRDVYGGYQTRSNATLLENLGKKMEQSKANWAKVAGCDLLAGKLFAGSGLLRYGGQEGFSLDWALISLSPRRDCRNKIPTGTEIQILDTGYEPLRPFLQKMSPKHLVVHSENKVFKQGRKTGLTWGTVNAIKADIKFGDNKTPHKAWYIVGQHPKSFAERGDSGAFVLDKDGTWCGIVFGGSDVGSGYVTPVDVIVADIEKITGGKVSLP